MHRCSVLPYLFLPALQAATIQKINARAALCDPLIRDCSDLPTAFDPLNLDLPLTSGLTLPTAPYPALSFNTEAGPGLQTSNADVNPNSIEKYDSPTTKDTQILEVLNAPVNTWQGTDDVVNVPTVKEKDEIASSQYAAWDPVYGGWRGSCHMFGVDCQMCYIAPGDAPKMKPVCRDAVLSSPENKPGTYQLCFKDTLQRTTCIAHDPADDDTPDQPTPKEWDAGWWGYCDASGEQCAICWKSETGQSSGCVPAVKKILTSDSHPIPSTWLCFKGQKANSNQDCINSDRWVQETLRSN